MIRILIATLLIITGLAIGLKGRQRCFSFTFNWSGKYPQILFKQAHGWTATWIGDDSRDALFRTMIEEYRKSKNISVNSGDELKKATDKIIAESSGINYAGSRVIIKNWKADLRDTETTGGGTPGSLSDSIGSIVIRTKK